MQPEISLRCASCGASIRAPAMFCPECGKALAPVRPEPLANPSAGAEAPVAPQILADQESQPAGPLPAVELAPHAAPLIGDGPTDQPAEPGSKPGARARTREKLHRASSVASNVARGALEDNVKRVEKIHHVSTAMIEEATYDPSLRFVLVALGLFVIFVILLVLNKVMG